MSRALVARVRRRRELRACCTTWRQDDGDAHITLPEAMREELVLLIKKHRGGSEEAEEGAEEDAVAMEPPEPVVAVQARPNQAAPRSRAASTLPHRRGAGHSDAILTPGGGAG